MCVGLVDQISAIGFGQGLLVVSGPEQQGDDTRVCNLVEVGKEVIEPLAQLHEIPFDELKVDHGFVHGACRDPSLRAIVEASIAMARQLGMKTVAEGVEDRADWDFLRNAGCLLAQGYFIARPMPAAELTEWRAAWEGKRRDLLATGS